MSIPTTPQLTGLGGPTPTAETRDFIAVDDSGGFSFHCSEMDLVREFEYVDEARCIIDREGNTFRLTLDADRNLRLGRSFGAFEFHWLRQAWREAQRLHMQEHPLLRFHPVDRDGLLGGLFEILELEHRGGQVARAWTLTVDDAETHPVSLRDIDRSLADRDSLERVLVQDPFGHVYRPVRHLEHRWLPPSAGFVCYVEVPARVRDTAVRLRSTR